MAVHTYTPQNAICRFKCSSYDLIEAQGLACSATQTTRFLDSSTIACDSCVRCGWERPGSSRLVPRHQGPTPAVPAAGSLPIADCTHPERVAARLVRLSSPALPFEITGC